MSLTIQLLLWCCLQVTLLAVAALVFNSLFARRRPAAGAVIAASTLFAVVGLTAMALSPWPSWHLSWDHVFLRHAAKAEDAAVGTTEPYPVLKQVVARSHVAVADLPESEPANPAGESESTLQRVSDVVARDGLFVLGVLYLAGLAVMTVRIAWGFAAVRGYRRNSSLLTDRRLLEFVDVIRAELSCSRAIEVRESARLSTPTTIGWRRPVLLLPVDWRTWTDEECLAVLAHEIEHVRRGDFASWVAAQFGVALHFYHPLVHWLAARLRLQQELAADAAAARVLGGQRKYVTTLAAMALRQSDAAVAWPARAFLPTSKTFLRRIEMLHRTKSLTGDISKPLFCFSIVSVAVIALCAAGFRGSAAGDEPRAAEEPAASTTGEKSVPPQMVKATKNHLQQLALGMHNYHALNRHLPPAVVIGPDGKTPHSWRVELLPFLDQKNLYEQYRMNEPWNSPANKKVLEQIPDVFRSPFDDSKSTNSGYYVFAGPGTVFDSAKGTPFVEISDGLSNTLLVVEAKRNIPWTKPEDLTFDPTNPPANVWGFVPGHFFAAMADGAVFSFSEKAVKDQLTWLILRHDGRPIDWEKLTQAPGDESLPRRQNGGSPELKIEQSVPRPDGNRAVNDMNNLRVLVLAALNYHDVFGHFPPAVVIDPASKTPRSWRVELLPFINGGGRLYGEYHKDEPWNSPANKKILEQMPNVFRSPYDDPKSFDSGYYVLAGPDTAAGASIREISDGTSNTLLYVSAKRNIPWTKPDDIPFKAGQSPPTLEGFVPGEFTGAMCDGSVHRFKIDRVKDQLKWLILKNDGRPIDLQEIGLTQTSTKAVGGPGPAVADDAGTPNREKKIHNKNNLKSLALALHNYQNAHGHFPAAVVMGPDGKTPHSWRVELLPFLNQKALYERYQMNEPWDSSANRKILAEMPDSFHSPYDDPQSPNSGYFALVGHGTVFEGTEGIKLSEVTDGTTNTVMLVESKRNIPWTKPEDIPFDPDKPLPALGGFVPGQFGAAMCDGDFRLYDTEQVKDQLKWLIMRNDGHYLAPTVVRGLDPN
jgi:beta-lactamase regulating signal transducer with metallopeptidase domain